jgi:hypothetical protein
MLMGQLKVLKLEWDACRAGTAGTHQFHDDG